MADQLVPIEIPPGIFRNGTDYQAQGRWHNSSLVRFLSRTIGPVGGWRVLTDDAGADFAPLTGDARGVFGWRGAASDRFLAIGTTQKLYLISGGVLRDITPAGFTAATSEDSEATSASGLYGAGPYGSGLYGTGSASSVIAETSDWHLDNFGDYLVGVSTSENKLRVWEGNVANPAIEVSGADFPTFVSGVVVTPEGFLVALGYSNGAANVRGVTWASQRTYTTWAPLITNSAGDYDLATAGRIMAGKRTRNETLIWTDTDMHVMTHIGGQFVYRFDQAGEKCGLIAPRAAATFDTKAMWMGINNFFLYDGSVQSVPSDVSDYVFGDMNIEQATKIWATTLAEFGEVWWFYPSSGSTTIDRYVVFNYREGHWTVGQLRRSAGTDAGALAHPVMVSPLGQVMEHEVATARAFDADVAQPLTTEDGESLMGEDSDLVIGEDARGPSWTGPFLESGPVQLGAGDRLLSVKRLLPDERTLGDVQTTIYAKNYPTDPEITHGPFTVRAPTDVRLSARQIRLRYDELVETTWRVGTLRLGVKPGARR